VTEDALQTERVGQFDLAVVCAEPSPEAAARSRLRNAEILEDYATQLQTHARQIVRRALEKQP
jgi:hypothetical protein